MTTTPSGSDAPVAGARYRADAGAADYWAFQEPIGRQTAVFDRWKMDGQVGPADRLVEFGCGGGYFLEALPAAAKIGVDANPLARAAGADRGLDIRPALSDVDDDWADVLWSHHALEHVLRPFDAVTEMRRVLRPGGRLVLWLPVDDWRAQRRAAGPDVNGHLWTWTPLLAHNLMAEAGFTGATARVVAHAWPRGATVLSRNRAAWRAAGYVAAVARRSRQLVVTATK